MTRAILIISAASAFAAIGAVAAPVQACDGAHACVCGEGHLAASPHLGKAHAQTAPRIALPEAPKREAADKLFYMRLGGAGGPAAGLHGGPDLGLGMRIELDRIGIDASMNIGVTQTGPAMEITGFRGSWMKLGAQYYLTPDEGSSPYLGAGLSWGGRSERISIDRYSATGLQAELSAGYEFLRSSSIRMFVQADATLPLYRALKKEVVPNLDGKPGASGPEYRWLPTMALSVGIAWGRVQKVQ